MASLGHVAVGIAAGKFHGEERTIRWMGAFTLLSLAPDLDVLMFSFDVPYEHAFGHRGASHSLFVALLGAAVAIAPQRHRLRAGVLGVLVLASHGLLDSLTSGGLGAALLWPLTEARYFAPWRPLPVAPIGLRLVSPRGLYVLVFEALVFSPLLIYGAWPRRRSAPKVTPAEPGQARAEGAASRRDQSG